MWPSGQGTVPGALAPLMRENRGDWWEGSRERVRSPSSAVILLSMHLVM
jgi:hypothetical protein